MGNIVILEVVYTNNFFNGKNIKYSKVDYVK